MANEGNGDWDLFDPNDKSSGKKKPSPGKGPNANEPAPDPFRKNRPGPNETTVPATTDDGEQLAPPPIDAETSRAGGSLMSHPAAPWLAVALALVVVIGFLVVGRSKDDSAAKDRGTSNTQNAGKKGEGEPQKNACPGYEKGTNLFTEPAVAKDPGVHIWHDIDGFHLRLVPGEGSTDSIQGTVQGTGAALTLVEPALPGSTDNAGLLSFDLNAANPELSFKRSCRTTSVTFDIKSQGQPVSPTMITIGKDAHPDAVPVVLNQLQP